MQLIVSNSHILPFIIHNYLQIDKTMTMCMLGFWVSTGLYEVMLYRYIELSNSVITRIKHEFVSLQGPETWIYTYVKNQCRLTTRAKNGSILLPDFNFDKCGVMCTGIYVSLCLTKSTWVHFSFDWNRILITVLFDNYMVIASSCVVDNFFRIKDRIWRRSGRRLRI